MKNTCENCSQNINGNCCIFGELEYMLFDCPEFELLYTDISMEEHLDYDMRLMEEEE